MDWLIDLVVRRYGRNILRSLLMAIIVYSGVEVDDQSRDIVIHTGTEVILSAIGLLLVEARSWIAKRQQER